VWKLNGLTTRNEWQSLVYSPVGITVMPAYEYLWKTHNYWSPQCLTASLPSKLSWTNRNKMIPYGTWVSVVVKSVAVLSYFTLLYFTQSLQIQDLHWHQWVGSRCRSTSQVTAWPVHCSRSSQRSYHQPQVQSTGQDADQWHNAAEAGTSRRIQWCGGSSLPTRAMADTSQWKKMLLQRLGQPVQ